MKKFTQEMVVDYAEKLLIGLKEDEIKMVLDEFNMIDYQINLINQIPNIENIEPMTHCLDDFEYELREDFVEKSIDIDDLLQNCDLTIDREIKVPKVVE